MMKLKKTICIILCLVIFILNMSGCENSSKKLIEDSSQAVISYTLDSYIAIITDKEEIRRLEKLFNEAEFEKTDASIRPLYLSVAFYKEKETVKFKIDDKGVIELNDGSYVKSEQISFADLYSILREHSFK